MKRPQLRLDIAGSGGTVGIVALVKKRDNSHREFGWSAFRTPKISIGTAVGQSAEVALETPFSFMVPTMQPYRFNIIFSDGELIKAARPAVQKVQQDWFALIRTFDLPDVPAGLTLQPPTIKKLRRAFAEFSQTPSYANCVTILNDLYYWEPGPYELTLHIQTARPNRSYKKTWPFTLAEGELADLQNNVSAILEEVCGLPLTAAYGFAYPAYNS